MPKQQRTMRIEQRSQLAAMQQLESRSDEELEAETKFKAAAQAILGARAAERYDAKAARAHFQRALAAARPQERLQLRRMADASLALAERRRRRSQAGHRAPRRRGAHQAPAARAEADGAGRAAEERGHPAADPRHRDRDRAGRRDPAALGFGIVKLIALPFGGISLDLAIFYGLVLVAVVIGGLAFFGRRRQKRAQAERAEQIASRAR